MRNRKWKGIQLLTIVVFFFLSSAAYGDLCWQSWQETTGVPGQPDGKKLIKYFFTSHASRTETEGSVMIMNFNDMIMYAINTKDKTYVKTNLSDLGMPPGMKEGDTEGAAKFQQMMEKMMESITVTPTDETKTIAGYKCKKYNMNLMMTTTEYWASKDVKGYGELKTITKKMKTAFKNNPMLKKLNSAGIMDEIDGFPVQTVTTVMGGSAVTTLESISVKKSLPKDLFQVPKGYTLKTPGAPPPGAKPPVMR